jgi:outer membrane protein assembly factor BamB
LIPLRSTAVAALAAVVWACCGGIAWAGALPVAPSPTYQTNGRVETIVIQGTTAYIGGKFTSVRPAGAAPGSGEVVRNRAAAIDLTTGDVLPWNPDANATVQTIAVDGATVVLGGSFTTLAGKTAGRLAAVDATTGLKLWSIKPDKQVNDVVIRNGTLYAGGAFTAVGAATRPHLLAVNEHTGALVPNWDATADGTVVALAMSPAGSDLIIGGSFTQLDGTPVSHLGSVTPTGALTAWRPQFGPPVVSLGADTQAVYVGGVGDGGNFASFDLTTGAARWRGGTDGNVQAIALYDGLIYVGGHYENYCGPTLGSHLCPTPQPREKAMAIGSLLGTLQPWHPKFNSILGVFALAGGSGFLAVGGDFTRISGRAQQGFAVFPVTLT